MKLTIDLSKNINDLLAEIGIEDASKLEQIEYGAEREFIEKEKGRFTANFIPKIHIPWPEVAKRYGKFIRARYPLREFGSPEIFTDNPFWMLVENAWVWGNECDIEIPVEINCYFSRKGFLLEVKDRGKGFDATGVLDAKKRGFRFFRNGGSAFTIMDKDQRNTYSYNASGNASYMLCLLERNLVTRDR